MAHSEGEQLRRIANFDAELEIDSPTEPFAFYTGNVFPVGSKPFVSPGAQVYGSLEEACKWIPRGKYRMYGVKAGEGTKFTFTRDKMNPDIIRLESITYEGMAVQGTEAERIDW